MNFTGSCAGIDPGEEAFAATFAQGRAMSLELAVAYALEENV